MVTQEEWNKRIKILWGLPIVIMELSELSVDENIGLARQLEEGFDPYKNERMTKAQEMTEIMSNPGKTDWIKPDDKPYFELLISGLINYPPQDRLNFLRFMQSAKHPIQHMWSNNGN